MLPASWFPTIIQGGVLWAELWKNFPKQALELLNKAGADNFSIEVRTPDLKMAATQLDRASSRVAISRLVAGFIVATGLTLPLLDFTRPWSPLM